MKRRELLTLGGGCGGVCARRAQTGCRRSGAGRYVVDLSALPPSDCRPAR